MTFQEAEKTYKDLRSQHAASKVTDADFEAQVNLLKVQDANGRWWQLGVRTGEWYFNDGQKWVKGKPPVAATPAPAPAAPPENQPTSTPAVVPIPAPAPAITPTSTLDSSSLAKEDKPERASVMPRGLFAAKPEGSSGGGLSRPVLIGIIAVVAIVVIALLVGGYFLLSGGILGGGTARATATTTQVALVPATSPTAAFTSTPAVTDTPAATATLVVTATNTSAPAARPSNTRAPVVARTNTPTKAAVASATPAPPPGLYVTKIAIDRAIEANQKFGFRVTFFNNSGGPAHKDNWVVLVFRDSDYVEGTAQKPFGQTPKVTLDVPVGISDILIPDAYSLGTAGPPQCTYQAEADYIGDNNNPVPFTDTKGKTFRFAFPFCQ